MIKNVLFIWYGLREPLYTLRDKCIINAIQKYPEAKFRVITSLKAFYDMEIVNVYDVIDEMKKEDLYTDINHYMALSDEMRFWWLKNNPETLYLDTDTWCEETMPYMKECGHMNIEALWNGNNEHTKPFDKITSKRIKGELFNTYIPELYESDSIVLDKYFSHKAKWTKQYQQPWNRTLKSSLTVKTSDGSI